MRREALNQGEAGFVTCPIEQRPCKMGVSGFFQLSSKSPLSPPRGPSLSSGTRPVSTARSGAARAARSSRKSGLARAAAPSAGHPKATCGRSLRAHFLASNARTFHPRFTGGSTQDRDPWRPGYKTLTGPGASSCSRASPSGGSAATRGRLSRRAKGFLRAAAGPPPPPLPPAAGKGRRCSPAARAARRAAGSGSSRGGEAAAPRLRALFRRSRTTSGGFRKLGE